MISRKEKGEEGKNESSDVSYKSLTDAVIRIFETGQTSSNDQSLLDAANKRVIQELYDGNVHLMSMPETQKDRILILRVKAEGHRYE